MDAMQSLSASELLKIWEAGRSLRPLERAGLLMAAAYPQVTLEDLGNLTVGQRNARLLALRGQTLGPRADCRTTCLSCGTVLEFNLDLPALIGIEPENHLYRLSQEGFSLEYRLPTCRDLAEIAGAPDLASARSRLIAYCVQNAEYEGRPVGLSGLPEAVVQGLADAILEQDPLADLRLALNCASCGQQSTASLDVVGFFWSELEALARRLLREVHSLAQAYGWREADILSLSPARRQVYLELVAG
jgi:hypothetical protein